MYKSVDNTWNLLWDGYPAVRAGTSHPVTSEQILDLDVSSHLSGEKEMKTKVLVIFYPECIEFEAILAAQVLHEEHMTIDVATPDGTDYHGPSGIALRATHSYREVHPEEYRVVIVPGGDTKSVLENEALVGILNAANDAGASFGAICGGPLLLAKAGLLKGRRFTHGYGPNSSLPYWKDGTYENRPVVVDGNIVTAQPQAYIDFAIEVLYAAGLRDNWAVESMRKSGKIAENIQSEIEGVKAHYKAIWGGS
jgi:4-methyl-5(b-hydroxyethyl)-thiazole monophosphate biosynthesis